mgnify:CR=1 FL=1
MTEYVIPSKYMYATKTGKQFITSYGSECTRRIRGGKSFECTDGVWVRPFLKDLKFGENSVEVDLTVTLKRHPHSHRMWLFGAKYHRRLVEWKPKWDEKEGFWLSRGGAVYCAVWCDKEFFQDLPDDQPTEVYVSAKRV